MFWEYAAQTTGQRNSNPIPRIRPELSYHHSSSMHHFPHSVLNAYRNSGNYRVRNCSVPAENVNANSSIGIDSSATVNSSSKIGSDAGEDNVRLNTDTRKIVVSPSKFNPPKKTELTENDLKLVRDHFAGKIKLGIDFIRYLHNIPKPIPRGVPQSDPELILDKSHRWSTWVSEPYPKMKPKNDPKFILPKSRGWATTWDEIRGGVIDPVSVDEGKSSETESDLPLLPNNPEEPTESSDEGIIVSISLNKLTRIPQQRN